MRYQLLNYEAGFDDYSESQIVYALGYSNFNNLQEWLATMKANPRNPMVASAVLPSGEAAYARQSDGSEYILVREDHALFNYGKFLNIWIGVNSGLGVAQLSCDFPFEELGLSEEEDLMSYMGQFAYKMLEPTILKLIKK